MGEFFVNGKFITRCLHVVSAILTLRFAISKHIFGTTKSSMFTNLLLWMLFILACKTLIIQYSTFLSSKV